MAEKFSSLVRNLVRIHQATRRHITEDMMLMFHPLSETQCNTIFWNVMLLIWSIGIYVSEKLVASAFRVEGQNACCRTPETVISISPLTESLMPHASTLGSEALTPGVNETVDLLGGYTAPFTGFQGKPRRVDCHHEESSSKSTAWLDSISNLRKETTHSLSNFYDCLRTKW
jgi:hypothetical protein